MKTKLKRKRVPAVNFRWTNDDLAEQLPERYQAALLKCGFSFSGATRAMIRHFTEEIETTGCPHAVVGSAKRVAAGKAKKKR